MKTAYVAIKIKTDDFLNGLNPTTQPGVRLPYYPKEEKAMQQAHVFSRELSKACACFVAAVEVQEVYYGKLDTLNPSAVHTLSMAVCKPGETPNQNNTVVFSTKTQSMQEICDTAREIVAHVREGMSMMQALEMARRTPSCSIPQEYTAGYGMRMPAQEDKPYNHGITDVAWNQAPNGLGVAINDHHPLDATIATVISEYAAKQLAFLPEDLQTEAMNVFNAKMTLYAQAPEFIDKHIGYAAAAITYTMQVIADEVTMHHPECSRQAYDTMCTANTLATEHGIDWSEMEYRPDADHATYLADHCKGMTAGMAAVVTAKYNEFFRESHAYTVPEQQALALYAAVSDICDHWPKYVVSGDMRGNDRKIVENLRDEMAQELADRDIRPGVLLDDIGDDTVGDDTK